MQHTVRNIWCAALNYHDLAKESKIQVPFEPVIFLKAGSTITEEKEPILLPAFSEEVFYELEIALQFNEKLEIGCAGLALDLTARDIQKEAKAQGHPWTLAKSFKKSCPVGSFFPIQSLDMFEHAEFTLEINGHIRQHGQTRNMVFSCKKLVSYILAHYPVCPYDIILTGTPAGLGPLNEGDELIAKMGDHYQAKWTVA